jgi:hypothetical protein
LISVHKFPNANWTSFTQEQLEDVFALLFGGRVEAKPEYKPRAAQSVDFEQPSFPACEECCA